MATFQNWLADQLIRPETDPIGWLARQWKSHEGNRPRVSSPVGIGRFLEAQAGEDAQLKGYVNDAVQAATMAYRDARESTEPVTYRDGTPANAAAEALNPATGKPVAVVPSSAWITHPDASQFGSCGCGWARGLAHGVGEYPDGVPGTVITCAAGHTFEPEKPGPLAEAMGLGDDPALAAQRAANDQGQPAGPGGGGVSPDSPAADGATGGPGGQMTFSYSPGALSAPGGASGGVSWPGEEGITVLPPGHADRPEPDAAQIEADAQRYAGQDPATADEDRNETIEQILVMQGMLLHVVTRIAKHIGLPPEQLDAFAEGAAAAANGPVTQVTPPAPWVPDRAAELAAQAPADLSSQLYGLIPQPPNDPQSYASWFNAAEYGDPGA